MEEKRDTAMSHIETEGERAKNEEGKENGEKREGERGGGKRGRERSFAKHQLAQPIRELKICSPSERSLKYGNITNQAFPTGCFSRRTRVPLRSRRAGYRRCVQRYLSDLTCSSCGYTIDTVGVGLGG